jgi:hypothetical protein
MGNMFYDPDTRHTELAGVNPIYHPRILFAATNSMRGAELSFYLMTGHDVHRIRLGCDRARWNALRQGECDVKPLDLEALNLDVRFSKTSSSYAKSGTTYC